MTVFLHLKALALAVTSFFLTFYGHCSQFCELCFKCTQVVLSCFVLLGAGVLVLDFFDFLSDTHFLTLLY